jgi:hypothetical protein
MECAELNGKQAAHVLGWSESWVSRLLSGKRGGSALDVAAFLGVCRAKAPERDRLLALCQDQHIPGWFQPHGSRLPKQLVTFISHEDKAVAISDFEAIVVPGLLQTREYARALISRSGNVPAEEVDERVTARLARQTLFSRERPARFTFYVHESMLRTPPVTYLESTTSSLFLELLERPEETAAYRSILGALADTALDEQESRELIASLPTELYVDREDHDNRA